MEIGNFFRVSHKGVDDSHSEYIFFCTGHLENEFIIGVRLGNHSNPKNMMFPYKTWNVFSVENQHAALILLNG